MSSLIGDWNFFIYQRFTKRSFDDGDYCFGYVSSMVVWLWVDNLERSRRWNPEIRFHLQDFFKIGPEFHRISAPGALCIPAGYIDFLP